MGKRIRPGLVTYEPDGAGELLTALRALARRQAAALTDSELAALEGVDALFDEYDEGGDYGEGAIVRRGGALCRIGRGGLLAKLRQF